MITFRHQLGLASSHALRAMFTETMDGDVLDTAKAKLLDGMTLGTWKGRIAVELTFEEAGALAEELEHLGTTPVLLPEFETSRRNELVRLAFSNLGAALRLAVYR